MIQIDDYDLPITAAEKIIRGVKPYNAPDVIYADMFSIEEVKEIADYLMVYYNSNKAESEE